MWEEAANELFQGAIFVPETVFLEFRVRLTMLWFPVEEVLANEVQSLRRERVDTLIVDAIDVFSKWVYLHGSFCFAVTVQERVGIIVRNVYVWRMSA